MTPSIKHHEYASGGWNAFSLEEQLANVGSEVIRSIKWRSKDQGISERAAERALELLQFTKSDPKNRSRLRELCRLYEVLVNDLYGFSDYEPDLAALERYFLAYTFAASKTRAARAA